jgi:hypothetical protein
MNIHKREGEEEEEEEWENETLREYEFSVCCCMYIIELFLICILWFVERINYPSPPYLEYAYPRPNKSIVDNIANALYNVPKFYEQVLHLMNKMNLPIPFGPPLPGPPVHILSLSFLLSLIISHSHSLFVIVIVICFVLPHFNVVRKHIRIVYVSFSICYN